jgi:uncharacterized protein (DUF433 family)
MRDTAGNVKNYEERIIRDRGICGGEPVFKGTRVTLRTVLASLATGDSAEEILADFPILKPEDIRAAIAFAGDDRDAWLMFNVARVFRPEVFDAGPKPKTPIEAHKILTSTKVPNLAQLFWALLFRYGFSVA